MSARNELAGILAQWQQLTRAEGHAIETSAWSTVREIQEQKAALRQPLADAFQACARTERLSAFPFRRELGRILSLLTRNSEALAAQMRQAKARKESFEQTRRNLQRIHRSYLPTPKKAAWHSYS